MTAEHADGVAGTAAGSGEPANSARADRSDSQSAPGAPGHSSAAPSRPRPRVVVVHPLSSVDADERLAAVADVVRGGAASREELESLLREAEGVVLRPPTVVDAALLEGASRLRVIGNIGTGLDHIDLAEAERRGIAVVAGRGGNANAVAEYVAGMLLAVTHKLFEARQQLSSDAFSWPGRLAPLRGNELRGRVLGIAGVGAIGRRLAQIATAGLQMRVVAYDPFATSETAGDVRLVASVGELCSASWAVSVHAPLTPDTRSLIGSTELALLAPDAILVNASRGGVVDEEAVIAALRSGTLAAAVLDVFEDEPPLRSRLAELAAVPGLYCTPHIAGVTAEAGAALCDAAVDGVLEQLGLA